MATVLHAQVHPHPTSLQLQRHQHLLSPPKESRFQTSLLLLTIHSQATHCRGKAEISLQAPGGLAGAGIGWE